MLTPKRSLLDGRWLSYHERSKMKSFFTIRGNGCRNMPLKRGRKDKITNQLEQKKKAIYVIYIFIDITFLTLRTGPCLKGFYLGSFVVYGLLGEN